MLYMQYVCMYMYVCILYICIYVLYVEMGLGWLDGWLSQFIGILRAPSVLLDALRFCMPFSQNKRRIVLGIRAFCVPVFLFVRFYISHCNCFCRREKDALQDSLDESFILSWCWWGGRHWRIFIRNCGWAFWQFCDKISKTGFLCPSNRVITRKKPPCP